MHDHALFTIASAGSRARSALQRMVDEDAYCVDILTQVAAVQTALEQVAVNVLDGHVRHCVADAVAGTDEGAADAKLDELMAAVRRFAKVRCRGARRRLAGCGRQHVVHELGDLVRQPLGASRSSMIELACSSRAVGQFVGEHPRVGERVDDVVLVADHQRRRLERPPLGAVRRERPKNRPWRTAALGSGGWRTVSSRMSACHGSRRGSAA